MRLVTYTDGSGSHAGVLRGGEIVALSALGAEARTVRELLQNSDAEQLAQLAARAETARPTCSLDAVALRAPVPDAGKIICLGLNYRDHAAETNQEIPQAPMWFAKFATSLIGDGEAIVLPAAHPDYVDYEAELAVVIGRTARQVSNDEALAHVAGAMAFNDVSARDLQLQNPLWTSGKAIDTFAPCGPALVTLDELPDLQTLVLRTTIDGEIVQSGTTAEMIFGVAETIAWLSRTLTLEPGDIIATGTPAGIGALKGRFLRAGATVAVEIDGIGTVTNPVQAP